MVSTSNFVPLITIKLIKLTLHLDQTRTIEKMFTLYYVYTVLGVGFIKTEPFNLSSLFTENDEKVLQDLSGFWSYNDTSDISKYEDFDHSKLLGKNNQNLYNLKIIIFS